MADKDTMIAQRFLRMLEAGDAAAIVELIRTVVRDEMQRQRVEDFDAAAQKPAAETQCCTIDELIEQAEGTPGLPTVVREFVTKAETHSSALSDPSSSATSDAGR